jgi:exonuclease VII large subunit
VDFLYSLYEALLSINVPSDRARAVVDAMERDMVTVLATRADLDNRFLLLKQEIASQAALTAREFVAMGERMDQMEKRLEQRIEAQGRRLDERIDQHTARLEERIEAQGRRLDERIDQQGARFEAQLEARLDTLKASMTVRLGSMLFVSMGLLFAALRLT